ncbi:MAG: alpha-ribazole phosphatase [Candidatus Pseudobacter hemicellulosilyticus]|uniref:Alpha-ribazole phosphatase n=1 Tax=Candidatus Pseudobacter hemicellulosilyticus TaxID=3121375 RepID=A0AAJ5WY72_9BACT|nr:MAG: alpha-ribazole phosphatase [Pseudobacter sp.]
MSIYLVRHTAPQIEKGTCYGQADIDVTATFREEASVIHACLPAGMRAVYSSPLQRCRKLAEHLFPGHPISWEHDLKEINCGEWELQRWDDIPPAEVTPWMDDFVNVRIPGGESYVDVFDRVVQCYQGISRQELPAVVVTHGGVIRSILAYITGTPLKDSFSAFSLHYGCVVKIAGGEFELLSNVAQEKEQHKPTGMKKG